MTNRAFADQAEVRTLQGFPIGAKVRDWDSCLLVKVGPDAWQVDRDSGEGTLNEGAVSAFLIPVPSEVLVKAYGPITVAEMPEQAPAPELREIARRAAAEEYNRRFTLCQTTRGQAYTDAIAAAVLSALTPYLKVEAPK